MVRRAAAELRRDVLRAEQRLVAVVAARFGRQAVVDRAATASLAELHRLRDRAVASLGAVHRLADVVGDLGVLEGVGSAVVCAASGEFGPNTVGMSTAAFSSTMFAVEKSPTVQPARVNGTHGAGVTLGRRRR